MTGGLATRRCVPCGARIAAPGAIATEHRGRDIPAWGARATSLREHSASREVDAAFPLAAAGAEHQHPDIGFGRGAADFVLTTHAIGGLSENDLVLAIGIDSVAARV